MRIMNLMCAAAIAALGMMTFNIPASAVPLTLIDQGVADAHSPVAVLDPSPGATPSAMKHMTSPGLAFAPPEVGGPASTSVASATLERNYIGIIDQQLVAGPTPQRQVI